MSTQDPPSTKPGLAGAAGSEAPSSEAAGRAPDAIVERVTVLNPPGLHARPASVLAAHAKGFTCEIALVLVSSPSAGPDDIGMRVDAKNILDVIVLGAPEGAELDVEARGSDAAQAVASIARLFAEHFGMRD